MESKRLKEVLKKLRKEATVCLKYSKEHAKSMELHEALELRESSNTLNWAVDTIEYYLEHGQMP